MGNFVVGLVLTGCVALAVRSVWRHLKNGQCIGCSGCKGGEGCHCREPAAGFRRQRY